MKSLVWFLVVLLAILHFDFWWWDDKTLVFGFLPIGLAFHAGFSIACSIVWLMAVTWSWPADIESWADEVDGASGEVPFQQAAGHADRFMAAEEESL